MIVKRLLSLITALAVAFTWHVIDAPGAEKEKFWNHYCREYVFNQHAVSWEKNPSPDAANQKPWVPYCEGYLEGLFEAWSSVGVICVPDDTRRFQIEGGVHVMLNKSDEKDRRIPPLIAMRAWQDDFPCKKDKQSLATAQRPAAPAFPTEWQGNQEKRFLEFPNDTYTVTFDLNTVQIIQPGRFTVIEMTIDKPDMMRFELKVLATLRTYCARAVGQYPAPADLLMLGPPDMPVKNIEVSTNDTPPVIKRILWYYPYKRLRGEAGALDCRYGNRTEQDLYSEARSSVTNGIRQKDLYDCQRGLWGSTIHEDDDPTAAIAGPVPLQTLAFEYYQSVCQAVTHEAPYVPNE
jgi:hypothetical protein